MQLVTNWRKSIFPDKPKQKISLDDLLLMAAIWQKQVQQISNTDLIVNIDLLRQQIVYAQYIPINLVDGVTKLNALVDKVATYKAETEANGYTRMELKTIMNVEGTVD